MAEQQTHVGMELFAGGKTVMQSLHEILLLGRQYVRILRVNRREVARREFILHLVHLDRTTIVVDGIKQLAAFHVPAWMAVDEFSFQFPLYHADGLVHAGIEKFVLLVEGIFLGYLRHEFNAGIVAIDIHGKRGQLDEIDAVAILEGFHVGIAQGDTDDVAHAGIVAGGSAHPQNVVIAPSNVPSVVVHQRVHHDVGARTTVVDIAQNVELIDAESLNHTTEGNDEVIGTAGRDDGLDDGTHIVGLVLVFGVLVKKFLYDIGEVNGQ